MIVPLDALQGTTIHYPFEVFSVCYAEGHCKLIRAYASNVVRVVQRIGKQLPDEHLQELIDKWDGYEIRTPMMTTEVNATPQEWEPATPPQTG